MTAEPRSQIGNNGTSAFNQCRPAARRRLAGSDRPHRHLEGAGHRPAQGAPAQHRWRRPGRYGRSWRRTSCRIRLSGRILSVLAGASRSIEPRSWPVRRELYGRGPRRHQRVRRGPLQDRLCPVRSDAAARHLLTAPPSHGRARPGIPMDGPDMAALLVRHGRPGFYFRVIEEGDVEAGDEITQIAVGPERMSVFEINALLYLPPHPRERLERALRIPALSRGWRRSFEALLEHQKDKTAGNAGLGPAASP